MVASPKPRLYLGVLLWREPCGELEVYCKGRWRQKEMLLASVASPTCAPSSLVSGCARGRTMRPASISLLTADGCEIAADQLGLPEFFLSTLAAANATAWVPAPSLRCQGKGYRIAAGEGGQRAALLWEKTCYGWRRE